MFRLGLAAPLHQQQPIPRLRFCKSSHSGAETKLYGTKTQFPFATQPGFCLTECVQQSSGHNIAGPAIALVRENARIISQLGSLA